MRGCAGCILPSMRGCCAFPPLLTAAQMQRMAHKTPGLSHTGGAARTNCLRPSNAFERNLRVRIVHAFSLMVLKRSLGT